MRFLFCLILLSSIFVEYSLTVNETEYTQCTSCSPFTVSFSEALSIPPQCQADTPALVCGIEYRINYDTKNIHITFQASNDIDVLSGQSPSDVLIQTIRLGLSKANPSENEIVRKYSCNTNNDCAKQYYLKSINYFVTDGITQLDSIRTKLHNDSLIIGEGSRRHCINSDKLETKRPADKCKDGLCYAKFEEYKTNEEKIIDKIQRCDLYINPSLLSESTHHTPELLEKDKDILEYRCNKHVCNRIDFVDKIKSFLTDYTSGISKIPENKSIMDKAGNLSIKQTISSFTLVLSLFLIQLFI